MLAALRYHPLVRIRLGGALAVSPHGIFTVLGFLVGANLFLRDTRRLGVPDDEVLSTLTRAGVAAIVGARVAYVANNFGTYDSPLEWLEIWKGGISLLGGLVAALLVAWWSVHRTGRDFLTLLDRAAPWLPLGVAIGRIGDVVIADHLGRITTVPFGFQCPAAPDVGRNVGSPCPPGQVVHLTAAYDLLAVLAIFAIVWWLRERAWPRRGLLSLVLGTLYGLNRFALDFFREDTRHRGLTGSQWVGLGAAVAGTVVLVLRARRPPDEPPPDLGSAGVGHPDGVHGTDSSRASPGDAGDAGSPAGPVGPGGPSGPEDEAAEA
ncbi:MAG: prolipoprotein diacylglyceryl transferase [Actinobacteria bacterium]|nr:prolipoprotein diacylglyceryl transferase [Actinomycetota bacterium]